VRQSDWSSLMSNLGFSENTDTYTDLKRRYNENHRKYHNVAHIESVLIEFGKTRYIAENNSSVELALWFHDAIYNTFSKSNEKESADLAVSFISSNSGTRLIVDIDLSILGTAESRYEEFETAIRKEYKYVPWFIFKRKRIELLQYFLDRESIYSQEYYIDSLEKQARVNIKNAIAKLKST